MTKNALPATLSPVYDQGDGTFGTSEPSGGTIIANPMMLIDFGNLSNGQNVLAGLSGSVAGSQFDAALGNVGMVTGPRGPFGIAATTAISAPGKTSSCICSIAQGSEGDPAGGGSGVGYGPFGGILEIKETATNTPMHIAPGEEFWYGFRMFIPENFNFATNTGLLKYIRHDTNFNVGRIENMVVNGLYNGSSSANQIGWGLLREGSGNDKAQSETNMISNRNLVKGAWNWVEMYMKPYFDRNLSQRRIWLNGQFVCERVGNVNKYINASGVLTTQTIGSGDLLLTRADDAVENIYFSTYWNGNSPQDQAWYIDRVVGEKNPSKVLAVDEYGNKMMGPQ